MKCKISVSVEEKSLPKIRELMRLYSQKNKSQAIELFLKKILEEIK